MKEKRHNDTLDNQLCEANKFRKAMTNITNIMNANIEFLQWIPTQGEKHLGIAVVRYERRFIFRFKVLPEQSGNGLWVNVAAFKTGIRNGKDFYEECFQLDSIYDDRALKDFVKENVSKIIYGESKKQDLAPSASIFSTDPYVPPSPHNMTQPEHFYGNNQSTEELPF